MINDRIQFTVETENDFAVPFLDMKVIRKGNQLLTDWYRKPMSSGRYINWSSYHPMNMKINLIRNLKSRISKISHESFRDKNLKILEDLLIKNGYPIKWLKKIIYNIPNIQEFNEANRNETLTEELNIIDQNEIKYITLPFDKDLTKRLKSLIPKDKFKIATSNIKTIRLLFTKVKDQIDNLNRSNVVYKINCNDCDKCYIGQTTTKLKQRISLHKSNIRTNKDTCALSIHSKIENHQPNFNNIQILDIENNLNKRTFLEMVRIIQNENSINSRKDICNLSSMYSYLIQLDSLKHINNINYSFEPAHCD